MKQKKKIITNQITQFSDALYAQVLKTPSPELTFARISHQVAMRILKTNLRETLLYGWSIDSSFSSL